ncbi:MAG: DUF2892 domain-containing protein [Candidatus Zixiibacteriota bacterium]|nr:MAG: DUF2892 domain-containing protein [candidate division Zixibacteria bacterium]HDL03787.1 DUF2892 domain-containing protein [candidate division Zixibacteria bacterium]
MIRFLIGIAIIAIGLINTSWRGLFGLIPVLTALTGFCGIYAPFGV